MAGKKQALVEFVKTTSSEELKHNIDIVAAREFVKDEIKSVRDEISNLRLELKEFKSEIIKWMFVFRVGSILTTSVLFLGWLNSLLNNFQH